MDFFSVWSTMTPSASTSGRPATSSVANCRVIKATSVVLRAGERPIPAARSAGSTRGRAGRGRALFHHIGGKDAVFPQFQAGDLGALGIDDAGRGSAVVPIALILIDRHALLRSSTFLLVYMPHRPLQSFRRSPVKYFLFCRLPLSTSPCPSPSRLDEWPPSRPCCR